MSFTFDGLHIGRFLVLLLSVSLHESAHAFTADALGDDTARRQGRVTLNPAAHLHPVMSVLLPALLIFGNYPFVFGAGRPVPVVASNFRRPTLGFALVAVAGPLTNVLLAVVSTVALVAFFEAGASDLAAQWLRFAILLNLLLAVFNLIPVPPLDGSRVVALFLPRALRKAWYALDAYGFLILVVLFVTGVLGDVLARTYRPLWNWWTETYGQWM